MSQLRYNCLIYSNKINEWHWQLIADNGTPIAQNAKPLATKAIAVASVRRLFNVREDNTSFPKM